MSVKNSKGQIYYGMHFYPGLAQYQEEGQEPYRVFLNEDTIRSMDPTFAGRPIFVEHVDDVDPDLNELRKEADGWVVESFFNTADGKHWVKFIVVSDRADRAIRSGMRLSNAYIPKSFKDGGLWNGIPYIKEITDAEYEHLAIVNNPRYEESVILTPEEFKEYNSTKVLELKKLSNSKTKGTKMKFSFFKKTKVENALDPELQVVLPSSGKIVSIEQLINDADKAAGKRKNGYESKEDPAMDSNPKAKNEKAGESAKSHSMANMDHMVKMHDGGYMKVKDLVAKHKSMMDDMEEMKSKKEDSSEEELDLAVEPSDVDAEGDMHNDPEEEGDMSDHEEEVAKEDHKMEMKDDLEHPEDVVHDEEDEDKGAKKKLQLVEPEDKEVEAAKKDGNKNKKKNDSEEEKTSKEDAAKKTQAKVKADKLRNAHLKAFENSEDAPTIELSADLVERGKSRYGS